MTHPHMTSAPRATRRSYRAAVVAGRVSELQRSARRYRFAKAELAASELAAFVARYHRNGATD